MELMERCNEAFIGTANLNVTEKECKLAFRTFNPACQTQQELVHKIAKMMSSGASYNKSNPLVMAVNPEHITSECFQLNYNTITHTPCLHSTTLSSNLTLEVLDGVHRITAT